jgi:hypothetical protein
MNLRDLCLVFDDALDSKVCDDVIDFYEEHSELYKRQDRNARPNFTQLHFTDAAHFNPILHDKVTQSTLEVIEKYKNAVRETKFFPRTYGYEKFRIKCYNNDGYDQFDTHADATILESSKRFLVFFWYLNDVEEGGETSFPFLDLIVKPKKGRLLMFPPYWMWPHKGHPVISNKKYLLSSYLHLTS